MRKAMDRRPSWVLVIVLAWLVGGGRASRAGNGEGTYFGSDGEEEIWDLAVHPSGDIIAVGWSGSAEIPVGDGATEPGRGNLDAVVLRLAPDLGDVVSITVIGGSGEDRALTVDVAPDGTVVVGGHTNSADFPVTDGAYQTATRGTRDGFIAVVDTESGTQQAERILYATLFGGGAHDGVLDLKVGDDGIVSAEGVTTSTDLPTVRAFQMTYGGGAYDAFVIQLLPDPKEDPADQLLYATYLGGGDLESEDFDYSQRLLTELAVDSAGRLTVVGMTDSADFPTTPGAYDATIGRYDVFVVQIDPSLPPQAQLVYGTGIGGSHAEGANTVSLDEDGNIWLGGFTRSSDFPTTPGAIQGVFPGTHGSLNGLIACLRPDLDLAPEDQLLYSTFVGGGEENEVTFAVSAAGDGKVFAAGYTCSPLFPVTDPPALGDFVGAVQGFVLGIEVGLSESPASSTLAFSTTIGGDEGGTGSDDVNAVLRGPSGRIYLGGATGACDVPHVSGWQSACGGYTDGLVTVLDTRFPEARFSFAPGGSAAPLAVSFDASASSTPEGTEPLTFAWGFGDGESGEGARPAHTYVDAGRFLVDMVATNSVGAPSRATQVVPVACPPCGDLSPWACMDVGSPLFLGGAWMEGSDLRVVAGGEMLTGSADEFHFVSREVRGEFAATVRISGIAMGQVGAAVGLVARATADPGAAYAGLFLDTLSAETRQRFRYRDAEGGSSRSRIHDPADAPWWLRLERCGQDIVALSSPDGAAWTEVDRRTIAGLPETLLVGVAACGRDSGDPARPFTPLDVRLSGLDVVALDRPFVRGEANGDGIVDLSDAVTILNYLFAGSSVPCVDAADVDDDGEVVITDPIRLLGYLFLGGPPPAAPFPDSGTDPTDDGLSCGGGLGCG